MANITTRQTGALSADAFIQASDAGFSAAKPSSATGGTPFLKIDTETGLWTMGQEDIVAPKDALWGVFTNTFATGYVAWKGTTLEAKRMAMIGQTPVNPDDLPPVVAKTGWEQNVAIALVCVDCPSAPDMVGTIVVFEQRSNGGVQAWNKLYDATVARAREQKPDFAAIVSLDNTSYVHKEWGTVYKPIFKIEEWDTPAKLVEDFGAAPAIGQSKEDDSPAAEGPEVKAASRRRGAVADTSKVEDAEVVSEEPARRRRRSAE